MILAAPLQGYTTAAVRMAHAKEIGGIDEYFVPFARMEKGHIREKDLRDLAPDRNAGVPVVPQILVKNGDEAKCLIDDILALGYHRIDFNFACPFIKVTDKGYGAAMAENTAGLHSVLSVTKSYPDVVFSAKIRREAATVAAVFGEYPLSFLTFHPSFAQEGYADCPNAAAWKAISNSTSIPVVYNGGIWTKEDAAPFPDVMLGRGMLANPLLPLEIRSGGVIPDGMDRLLRWHGLLMERILPENGGLDFLKRFWEYLFPDGDRKLRKKIIRSRTEDEYADNTALFFQENGIFHKI